MATEVIFQHKDSRVQGAASNNGVAGIWRSFWEYEGDPSHGAVPPTSWTLTNNTTQGGVLQTDPAGGAIQKWIHSLSVVSIAQGGTLMLYDRLGHISGLSGASTSVQNINGGSPATVSRYTDGYGNSIWLEIYTAIGSSTQTLTVNYINQDGNSASTTVAIGGTSFNAAQNFIPVPLASGDYGVQALVSVQLGTTTGTAGNFGILVAHRLKEFSSNIGQPQLLVGANRGFIEILTDACLAWAQRPGGAQTAAVPLLEACFTFTDK